MLWRKEDGVWRIRSDGVLDKAWDEAVVKGWTVVSMKDDWRTIFQTR